jgi:hypothetical protein
MEKIRIRLFSTLFLLNESLQLTLGFEMVGELQMHTYRVYGDIILEIRPHLSSASKHCQKRKTVLCDGHFPSFRRAMALSISAHSRVEQFHHPNYGSDDKRKKSSICQ